MDIFGEEKRHVQISSSQEIQSIKEEVHLESGHRDKSQTRDSIDHPRIEQT